MACSFKRLYKNPKVFSRITGVSIKEFEKILKMAEPVWAKKVERIRVVSGRPYGLGSLDNHILCLLIYYRTYLTQEFLGFMFDVDDSCVSRSIRRVAKVLAPVLSIQKNRLGPEQEAIDIIIDCTEHPIQRPTKGQKNIIPAKRNSIVITGY